jgi:tetratricopeptide (TPR) repeat protein
VWRLALTLMATVALGLPLSSHNFQAPSPAPPGEITVRIIVVSSAEQAQRIVDRLNGGENFVALAKEESIDPSADDGGLIGNVALSALRPELREALQGVRPGQLSPVVRLPTGFAVLKVVDGTGTSADATPAMAATGSVKYLADVGGFPEAQLSLERFPKAADWNLDPRRSCETRRQALSAMHASLEDFLSPRKAAERASLAPVDLIEAYVGLGQLDAYRGKMDEAIERYLEAYQIALHDMPAAALPMEETLAIAYLHRSEMENDVYRAPGDRCLLPTPPGRSYAKTSDSEKAVEYFLKYLEKRPDELEVKWLLNIAHMTLGTYPAKVPQKHLIPLAAFSSTEDVGRFVDVAPRAGLNIFSTAGGLIVDDFHNSGRFDIVTSAFDSCGPMHLFQNNGDGTFTERTAQAKLDDQLGGPNIMQTDYNNDGCLDILVLRGGWELPKRKSLLRNNCDGTFTDVTVASGLAKKATSTQTAVWVDIDNDGFLDLFVGNEDAPAQLFLNRRDGTFEDIAQSAGVDRTAFSKGVAAADYDNDGYPDLYVSNFGSNFLYHNNHNKTFTELARAAGVPGPGRGFATWFFDYDNDGWPDLFVTSYFTSVEETARTYLRLPNNATTLKLYKNAGDGSFRDVTKQVGLDKVFMPMGANFGDIDNDGFLDIYLGTGNPSYGSLVPNVLLRNKEGKSFVDVTSSSGTGELHKGHGTAFADLDNDGDEDIIVEIGGATPGDAHALRLFENPGHGNDWITLKLVGVKTNRAAIGARIKVTVENTDHTTRAVYRTVGSGGSFGASPLAQHIGLGKANRIVDIEVWWPTTKTRQHVTDVDKNQWFEITEFAQKPVRLARPRIPLGTPTSK